MWFFKAGMVSIHMSLCALAKVHLPAHPVFHGSIIFTRLSVHWPQVECAAVSGLRKPGDRLLLTVIWQGSGDQLMMLETVDLVMHLTDFSCSALSVAVVLPA
jgi:hypothetical protein